MTAMLGVHTLSGLGEAVDHVAAVSAVLATRPDLIAAAPALHPIARRRAFGAFALAVAVAADGCTSTPIGWCSSRSTPFSPRRRDPVTPSC